MKHNFILFFSVLCTFALAQFPNDCVNYVQVCGNYNINLDVSGPGTQEIGTNVCQSFEHNSLWLHVLVEEGGTLGFNLKPQSTAITEDYDFWVFGPNVSCGNLGQAIRCSTTNPQAAGQSNNWTGLRASSVDTTEGPGPDGDSFLEWLTVQPGEEYFFVIDRPIGNSAFELEWTGTAVLDNPLEDYTLFDRVPLELCDSGNDGSESFDLTSIANEWINDLTGIEITYHINETDAFSDVNPLPNITDLQSTRYFVRIENVGSRCFEVKELDVIVGGLPLSSPSVRLCDEGNDNQEVVNLLDYPVFDAALNYTVSFHTSQAAAENQLDAVNTTAFTVTSSTTSVTARVEDENGCVDYAQINFTLIEQPDVNNHTTSICINETNNGAINLSNYSSEFQAQPQFEIRYYTTTQNRDNDVRITGEHSIQLGNNTIYVRVFNAECYQDRTLTINVLDKPEIGEDETIMICPESFPYTLPAIQDGFTSYVWSNQQEGTSITVEEIGDYTVEVTNAAGCMETKTFSVQFLTFPQITQVEVVNESKIVVTAASQYPILYSLDGGDWQDANVFENVEAGVHFIRVKLAEGCESEPMSTYVLKIYNFLSPNNDGLNDIWAFPGLEEFSGSIISIYDRYGKKVYSEDGGKPFIWNGTYNGQKLPTGDYWYIINLPDGRKHVGHITIKH